MIKKSKKLPPGAGPKLQGYFAYAVFHRERKPPSFHDAHTETWKEMWLQGYDEASANYLQTI